MPTAADVPERPSGQRDSRVLVLSQRNLHAPIHHALPYELEDLLATFEDVDLLAPGPAPHRQLGRLGRQALNGGLRRAGAPRRSPPWNRPSMAPTPVTADHDLFFAMFTDSYQLAYLHRIPGWRERSRRAVCLLFEVWSDGVSVDRDYLSLLSAFDEVHVITPAAAPALVALGSPAPRFHPGGVDAERFCPLPRSPERTIDLYSFGRRSEDVHRQLLAVAEQRQLTYLYDTLSGAQVPDHRGHRALLAHIVQRTQYLLTHRINDDPERLARTGGEESVSTRYFEGAAGGAVMLGSRARSAEFDACFDWPDAVVDLPWGGGDAAGLLDELAQQPERLARIRADGVRNSLRRFDWVHGWRSVLESVDLTVDRRADERAARLTALSDAATPEAFLRSAAVREA